MMEDLDERLSFLSIRHKKENYIRMKRDKAKNPSERTARILLQFNEVF